MRMSGAPEKPSAGLESMPTEELMRMKAGDVPQPSKMGAVEDVVRSLPGSIPRAAAAMVGLPQTLNSLARAGNTKVTEFLGVPAVGKFLNRSIPGLANAAAEAGLPNVGDTVIKGYDEISKAATGKPVHRPQTGAGRIADLTAQTIVSPGGSLAQKAVMGVSAGSAGEAARLVTSNPIAIGVIQMLGGAAASLPWILRSVPAENINAAIKDITPAQLAKAQSLMDDAAASGVKLTGAEAIAQVTGKNNLQDIQRVVEASKQGGPQMQKVMNDRPFAVRSSFEQQADQIAPMPDSPSATPARMAKAGEVAITSARKAGNEQARPFYEAAREKSLSPAQASATVFEPALDAAIKKVVSDPMSSAYRKPANSVAALDAAKKYLDDVSGSAAMRGENELSMNARTGAVAAKEVAAEASPEYAKALGIVSENRRNIVEPMKSSPVGDIAGTKGLPAEQAMRSQSEILMPTAPRALDPMTIRKSVATLSKQDPTAARDFVRQNVQAIFDEAAQNLSGGANQWGGAKFAAQVAGNPRQRDNLQALVESVGNRQTWNGFNRMLEVLEATGKRQAPGSQTAFNQQIAGELSAGGAGSIPAMIAAPGKAMSVIGNAYDNFRFGKNTAEMAKILMDPKSVELMTALAKEAPNSAKAAALVAQILAAQPALTSAQPSNTSRLENGIPTKLAQ